MPIKVNHPEEPTLNLTPMIDIVMLVMIFFMVSTEFIRRESQYQIMLPRVSQAAPITALPDELFIALTEEGKIYFGDEEVTLDQLEVKLVEAKTRYAEQAVVVRGDARSLYQPVMTILSICKRAGITNIQLANKADRLEK